MFKAVKRRNKAPLLRASSDNPSSSDEEDTTRVVKVKHPLRQLTSTIHTSSTTSQQNRLAEPPPTGLADHDNAPNLLHSRFVSGGGSAGADKTIRMTRVDPRLNAQHVIEDNNTHEHGLHEVTTPSAAQEVGFEVQQSRPQPILLSKLTEVDVPVAPVVKTPVRTPRPKKPRLGRDGRPLRPRARRERQHGDTARDAAVEAAMRVQEELAPQRVGHALAGGDTRTDDQMLAEMEKRFADAERRGQNRTPKVSSGTRSGPRLGGSRNARLKTA